MVDDRAALKVVAHLGDIGGMKSSMRAKECILRGLAWHIFAEILR